MAVLSGCAAEQYDPFKVPAGEVHGRVRTVAIGWIGADPALVDDAYARAQLEPMIAERLRAAGFTVVPSQDMDAIKRRATDDVGGVFNPVSGEVDKARADAVQEAVYRELKTRHGVDAVLYTRLSTVSLYMTGWSATFCGTDGEVYWPASSIGMLERTSLVVALCFNTSLYDLEGRQLYAIRSGVETIETYYRQTRAVRPVTERLRNQARLVAVVQETVGPLAKR